MNAPKGHDKPLVEGKYHYRYNDPYDLESINCIDCNAPLRIIGQTKIKKN